MNKLRLDMYEIVDYTKHSHKLHINPGFSDKQQASEPIGSGRLVAVMLFR